MGRKNNNYIVSISYLSKGVRKTIKALDDGTFRLPVKSIHAGREKTKYKGLTAKEVVAHEFVKDNDPVLTLKSGEKIRVFVNGDSSYMPAMSEGVVARHDKEKKIDKLRNKMKEKILVPPEPGYRDLYKDIFNFPNLIDYGDDDD